MFDIGFYSIFGIFEFRKEVGVVFLVIRWFFFIGYLFDVKFRNGLLIVI